eukprot:6203536-Prorocentrum_lima.AAC.1
MREVVKRNKNLDCQVSHLNTDPMVNYDGKHNTYLAALGSLPVADQGSSNSSPSESIEHAAD